MCVNGNSQLHRSHKHYNIASCQPPVQSYSSPYGAVIRSARSSVGEASGWWRCKTRYSYQPGGDVTPSAARPASQQPHRHRRAHRGVKYYSWPEQEYLRQPLLTQRCSVRWLDTLISQNTSSFGIHRRFPSHITSFQRRLNSRVPRSVCYRS